MILKFWFYWIISDDQRHLMMVVGSVAHLKVRDWEDYQESTYFFSPITALTSTVAPTLF
jgi:hypothetical protein